MQPEESVEVDRGRRVATDECGAGRQVRWAGNRNRRSQAVVLRFAVRNDHVEGVRRAALEEANEDFPARRFRETRLRVDRALEKRWAQAHGHERQGAGFDEHASMHGGVPPIGLTSLEFRSAEGQSDRLLEAVELQRAA